MVLRGLDYGLAHANADGLYAGHAAAALAGAAAVIGRRGKEGSCAVRIGMEGAAQPPS
jgi:hypothetical protein